jgi:hypothetical protein
MSPGFFCRTVPDIRSVLYSTDVIASVTTHVGACLRAVFGYIQLWSIECTDRAVGPAAEVRGSSIVRRGRIDASADETIILGGHLRCQDDGGPKQSPHLGEHFEAQRSSMEV